MLVFISAFSFSTFQLFPQDALRLTLSGQSLSAQRQRDLQERPFTIRWGDAKFLLGGSLGTEWNDNVNLSHANSQQDWIIRPMANVEAFYPVTDLNSLSFSLGLGYEKFLNYDEYDRQVISPGSQLGWDFTIKDFRINLHDRFSYEEDPTTWGAVTGRAQYGGFYNTIGFLTSWDLHDVILFFGYDHFNFISSSSRFAYMDRASDFGFLRAAFQVHPSAMAGLELSGGPTAYDQPFLNDNVTFSLGAFGEWAATEHIKLTTRGGFYQYDFSDNGLASARGGEQSGYYLNLGYQHDLRWSIFYTIDLGREAFMGNVSYLTEQWYASGRVTWRVIKNLALSTGIRYEVASTPGSVPGAPAFSGDYQRYNVNFRVSCPLTRKLTATADYRLWLRDADFSDLLGYTQNRVNLELSYHF